MQSVCRISTVLFVFAFLIAGCSRDNQDRVFLSKECSVDNPVKNTVQTLADPLNIGGWAFDKASGVAHEDVFVRLVSEDRKSVREFQAKRGTRRPDVARAYNIPAAEAAGFDLSAAKAELPTGRYSVYVVQKSGGDHIVCSPDYDIFLK
jgi:hypothetical protein